MLKIKDGYELQWQITETMKLCDSTKELIEKTKSTKNVACLKGFEVFLIQCNLVDNQYQQNVKVLQTFTANKSYDYLLNV